MVVPFCLILSVILLKLESKLSPGLPSLKKITKLSTLGAFA